MSRNRNRNRNRNHGRNRDRAAVRVKAPARAGVPAPASVPEENNPLTREQKIKAVLMALDGYSNAAAFLGDDSPLLSSGTYRRSGLTSNTELLTVTYRENWLAKRIIDMPCEDMTRAWYSLSTSLPEEDLRGLKKLEAFHSVKQEMTNALRWARLYGGSLALMVIRGEENILDQPLDPDMLLPDCFQGLLVLDRAQGVEPSMELVSDLEDPDFGLPEYYTVDLDLEDLHCVKIHHSRVLRFTGRELPRSETVAENYWGASELEHIWEELQKRSATGANIAQLVFQANITTLRMGKFGEHMAFGSERQQQAILQTIENENRMRTSYGLQLLSAEDAMETHSYSFGGLSEIYEQSTGEADLRNYYDMIAQMQERMLRPALEKLLPVMAISCWGYVPEDLEIVFEPVMTTSPAERAELVQKLSSDVIEAFKCGLLDRDEAREELKARGEELGVYTKV